jgi:threonine 3-dehydrogenase
MEKLDTYYNRKFGIEFRCLRYPAIISAYEYNAKGTASCPTELINAVVKNKPYSIYLEPNITLPFMYISDCTKGAIYLIDANKSRLKRRVYNFNGLSFSPEEYLVELKKIMNNINVDYKIENLRNDIVKIWPVALDDFYAKKEWDWRPDVDDTQILIERILVDVKKIK